MIQIKRGAAATFVLLVLALAVGCPSTGDGAGGAATADSGAGEVVAKVGDHTLTLAEIDERALSLSMKSFYEVHDARTRAANMLIAEHLVDREAESRGVTSDEVLKAEVQDKAPPVTDEQIQAFFNENQARMGGQSLEQVGGQIQAYLTGQSFQRAEVDFLERLKADAEIEINLEAPRVEVPISDSDPMLGPADAPVTIVEFSDFQCPYCATVGPTLKQVQAEYGDKVRVVYRHYPLPNHPQARPAAEAADCANEQGKFWEYHDKVFENMRNLSPELLFSFVGELGMDEEQFRACVTSGKYRDAVQQDMVDGQKLGVQSTPSVFVNGMYLVGAQPLESFKKIIDEELGL